MIEIFFGELVLIEQRVVSGIDELDFAIEIELGDAARLAAAFFNVARARLENLGEFGRRARGAFNLAEQSGDAVHATFAAGEWRKCSQFIRRLQLKQDLRDQAALQGQLVVVDRDARRQYVALIVNGGIENAVDKAAKQVHRQLAPNAAIAHAVEDLLRHCFEQRIRGGEVNECIALIVGDEFGAALDEQRSVVI